MMRSGNTGNAADTHTGTGNGIGIGNAMNTTDTPAHAHDTRTSPSHTNTNMKKQGDKDKEDASSPSTPSKRLLPPRSPARHSARRASISADAPSSVSKRPSDSSSSNVKDASTLTSPTTTAGPSSIPSTNIAPKLAIKNGIIYYFNSYFEWKYQLLFENCTDPESTSKLQQILTNQFDLELYLKRQEIQAIKDEIEFGEEMLQKLYFVLLNGIFTFLLKKLTLLSNHLTHDISRSGLCTTTTPIKTRSQYRLFPCRKIHQRSQTNTLVSNNLAADIIIRTIISAFIASHCRHHRISLSHRNILFTWR
jgi:hypothetical protein